MSDSRAPVEDRGELALVLGGATMGLRPSYEAIDAMEKALGRGIVDLARASLSGNLSLGETAQIACEAVKAWGRDAENRDAAGASPKRIACLILESEGGIVEAGKVIGAMLSLAVTGGYDSSGNPKPATTMTTTAEAPVAG